MLHFASRKRYFSILAVCQIGLATDRTFPQAMASTAVPPIAITISAKLKNVSEFVQCIVFISLLAAVGFCYLHGIMECWNNGQKRITSVFGSRVLGSILTTSP